MEKSGRHHRCRAVLSGAPRGFTLVESLFVLALLGVCLLVGSLSLSAGLGRLGARGAAQVWQAAGAWAQVGALWGGEAVTVEATSSSVAVVRSDRSGRHLQEVSPAAAISTNLARWRSQGGVAVRFAGLSAAPDGGGSLYFTNLRASYRVVVRPESGLTTSTWAGAAP
jgi:prepilin-type N-terminal cleavage/methylation domain-containing protein